MHPASTRPDESSIALADKTPPPLPPATSFQVFGEYASRLYTYLSTIENRLFSEGLHVLGTPPGPDQMAAYLSAYFGDRLPPAAVEALAAAPGGAGGVGGGGSDAAALAAARAALERAFAAPSSGSGPGPAAATPERRADAEAALAEAAEIRSLLLRNAEEVSGVLAGLEGRYVLPEAGGDLLRDGPGVLPTGGARCAWQLVRLPGCFTAGWAPCWGVPCNLRGIFRDADADSRLASLSPSPALLTSSNPLLSSTQPPQRNSPRPHPPRARPLPHALHPPSTPQSQPLPPQPLATENHQPQSANRNPTPPPGRNIHALDPYRMPSIAAQERGAAAGAAIVKVRGRGVACLWLACTWLGRTPAILYFWRRPPHTALYASYHLPVCCTRRTATPTCVYTSVSPGPYNHPPSQAHRDANGGAYPETVAINLWGLPRT